MYESPAEAQKYFHRTHENCGKLMRAPRASEISSSIVDCRSSRLFPMFWPTEKPRTTSCSAGTLDLQRGLNLLPPSLVQIRLVDQVSESLLQSQYGMATLGLIF